MTQFKDEFLQLNNLVKDKDVNAAIDASAKELMENVGQTFKVKETTTTIKEYNAKDLPLYFKWDKGHSDWYFRVRLREGKIVTDLLKQTLEGYELTYSAINSAFDPSNYPIAEDEWRNVMHKFIKQLRD
tara:strand:+ start:1129 stop:1515 length:387 start_codon:yes stop_codon:yes gene_type:complete